MPTITQPITTKQNNEWARSRMQFRALLSDGYTYELNDNGKVYMLKRKTPASTTLDLVKVIDEPTHGLKCRIADNSEMTPKETARFGS